jgi:DNA repair protein RadA/Sms
VAKAKKLFECQSCGLESAKWMGKCPNCGSWESFIELNETQQQALKELKNSSNLTSTKAIAITDVEHNEVSRFLSGDSEFDLVLGGGVVDGSLTLIGGSPGVGKSTLLLKVAGNIARQNHNVLYVSGEESNSQIKLRANRLDANVGSLYLFPEIDLNAIKSEINSKNYKVIVIDSIQTIYAPDISSAPGSVSQVRAITFELMRVAKEKNIAMFIIGHITKDGSIAGPRVLEHMVDCVLYFEGDTSSEIRMLRGFKNRFGSTSEIGIFEMKNEGLSSAKDITSRFFTKGASKAGSAVTVVLEGSRALIVEVQALVSDSNYSSPKRSSTGYESNRLTMLLALLEKKLELPFNQYDVFVNIAGGIKITETAGDLAVVAAILSSFRNRPISSESIFIGEVSLVGDIRSVYSMEQRLKEAYTHGFKKAITPKLDINKNAIKCYEVDEVSKIIEWL